MRITVSYRVIPYNGFHLIHVHTPRQSAFTEHIGLLSIGVSEKNTLGPMGIEALYKIRGTCLMIGSFYN